MKVGVIWHETGQAGMGRAGMGRSGMGQAGMVQVLMGSR
jgi:hypothetical protein